LLFTSSSALCSCSNCYRQKGKLNVAWTG
jgi:hypothetical protein